MSKASELIQSFIAKHSMTKIEFCRRCEINRFTLYNYLQNRHKPKPFIARRIEKETLGAIKAEELLE